MYYVLLWPAFPNLCIRIWVTCPPQKAGKVWWDLAPSTAQSTLLISVPAPGWDWMHSTSPLPSLLTLGRDQFQDKDVQWLIKTSIFLGVSANEGAGKTWVCAKRRKGELSYHFVRACVQSEWGYFALWLTTVDCKCRLNNRGIGLAIHPETKVYFIFSGLMTLNWQSDFLSLVGGTFIIVGLMHEEQLHSKPPRCPSALN